MRLRNIPNADEKINKSKYIIKTAEQYRGKMNELFSSEQPIHVEIGMGKGDFIITTAIKNPNINFIGIEKYASVLVKAIEKLENKNLNNLKIINMDANDIEKIFDHEIDTIYLNFSDPWPKAKHTKRRLTSQNFLEKYKLIFKNVNHIIMKTDNRKLFEYSIKNFNEFQYHIKTISLDLHADQPIDNVESEYEKKFAVKGYPIYQIEVEK